MLIFTQSSASIRSTTGFRIELLNELDCGLESTKFKLISPQAEQSGRSSTGRPRLSPSNGPRSVGHRVDMSLPGKHCDLTGVIDFNLEVEVKLASLW